jgi:hypothetical protein
MPIYGILNLNSNPRALSDSLLKTAYSTLPYIYSFYYSIIIIYTSKAYPVLAAMYTMHVMLNH